MNTRYAPRRVIDKWIPWLTCINISRVSLQHIDSAEELTPHASATLSITWHMSWNSHSDYYIIIHLNTIILHITYR